MTRKSGQRRGQKSRDYNNACPCGKEARIAGEKYGHECLRQLRRLQLSYDRERGG